MDAATRAPGDQGLEDRNKLGALSCRAIGNLNRRGRDDFTLDHAQPLQLLEALRQQPIGDSVDQPPIVAEAAGTSAARQQDGGGPATPDPFDHLLKCRTGFRIDRHVDVGYHLRMVSHLPNVSD